VEAYISERAGMDLSRVWDQYLRHAGIPTLLHYFEDGQLFYRWEADVEWFDMPVRVTLDGRRYTWIQPTAEGWRSMSAPPGAEQAFAVDRNFYVQVERLAGQ
jgi:hypothetical protein